MKYEVDVIDETIVTLDTYNSDLNLVINASKYSAEPLTKEGFAFMWAGARASHGAAKGKFCFEVKVIEHLDVSHLPADEPNPHVVRVGFSVDSTTLQLGEDPLSYGYGGTGKISTNCQFKDFGPPFMAGDVVLAVADMDGDLVQIGFAKNGKFIGWAYKVKKSELQGKALFPHVLSKNCSFEVNFGQRDEPYFKLPDAVKNYTFIGCLPMDQRKSGSRPPESRESCEMIMMCGLPGAGKSVWAADYSLKNQEKKYNILGTNNIIDKMKVMGLPRKRNYAGRWDVLIQMATKCLNSMFAIGSKLRRNYILDQTNVYPTAQRRKMRNFDGFKRIAVVVVPTEAEYKRRCDKRDREEGKEVPDSAVLEMKANFKLPEKGDIFDEVIFTELQRDEAEKLVKQYNEEGKAAMGPARKQFRPNEPMRDNKGFDNRKGNFGGRGDYGNYDNQNMQGPNSYGGNRGSFNSRGGFNRGRGGGNDSGFGGRSNDRGGFNSSRGGREGFDRNFGGFESNQDISGFDDSRGGRGSYDNFRGNNSGRGGRGGFDSRGRGRGGYESDRGGRGGYDGAQRGGYDGARGGGRGGYDGARGGGRGGYDGASSGGRGSYDGASSVGRGSYDGARGGGRGSYDGARGGGRGSYDGTSGGGRGSYDGTSGGGRGSYDGTSGGGRGSYDGARGGGRGSYDGARGGGRGSYGASGGGRGSYDGASSGGRGSFDGARGIGRGSYDGARGSGRGSYDSSRGGGRDDYDSQDSYGSRRDMYGGYGDTGKDVSAGGYGSDRGYDKSSRFDQGRDSYKRDYSTMENTAGSTRGTYGYSDYGSDSYSSTKRFDKSYDSSSSDYSRGSANRFQSSDRGSASLGGDMYPRDSGYSSGYATDSSTGIQSSYSKDYGYSSGSYGDYKSPDTADTYASRNVSSTYAGSSLSAKGSDPAQRYAGSGVSAGSKYSQGTGYSGSGTRTTRWGAETPQATASADAYSATRSQSYAYPKSDAPATSYQTAQTYDYQQGVASNTTSQQWMTSGTTSASTNPSGYGSTQAQWMQYGQQPSQYYSQ